MFFTDRRIRYQQKEGGQPSFRGYGHDRKFGNRYDRSPRRQDRRRYRIPRDVCMICHKKGCHSSRHKEAAQIVRGVASAVANLMTADPEQEVEEEKDEIEVSFAAFSCYISDTRAAIAMGVSPRSTNHIVDACLIDTGSSIFSSVGADLQIALCAASARPALFEKCVKTMRGIGGITLQTLGTILFWFYFGAELYSVKVYVLPGNTPMILSHRDLDCLGFNYQSFHKIITRMKDGYTESVEMRNNLPFLVFSGAGFFTESQLRTMHRNLGHPSIEKQMQVIENAKVKDLDKCTREKLKIIVDHCKACQLARAKPRRFLFSVKDDTTGEFNHKLEMDVVSLCDGNVLHIICTGTGFQQGAFLNKMTAASAWKTLKQCWINVYAGAPGFIFTDAGSNFTAEEMKSAASSMGIILKSVPTEAHNRIGTIERSHAILRSIYNKLKMDLPSIRREERLSMAFRAINDAPARASGISPTMLVFGILPNIPGAGFRGSMAE